MARATNKKSCEEPSCLHVVKLRIDEARPAVSALIADEDDEVISLTARRIVGVEAHDLAATRAVLADCVLERCDLTNAKWHRARLHRVSFVDCRLLGADFGDEAWLEDVTFSDCTLDLATFDTSTLRRVVFTRCRLEGAAFGGSKLERVAFPECILARCDLTGATAPGGAGSIDLRGASIAGASFDTRLLRALTILPDDAATIAAALGVTVQAGGPQTACKP